MTTSWTTDGSASFAELLEAARRAPVTLTEGGRPAAVVLSFEDYERMRGAAWDRLMGTMKRMRAGASERGMTDATLESLVADDS